MQVLLLIIAKRAPCVRAWSLLKDLLPRDRSVVSRQSLASSFLATTAAEIHLHEVIHFPGGPTFSDWARGIEGLATSANTGHCSLETLSTIPGSQEVCQVWSSASPSLFQGMVPNKPLSSHTPPQPGYWRIQTAMLFFLTLEILTKSTENLTTYLNAKNKPAE